MENSQIGQYQIIKYKSDDRSDLTDQVAIEAPLEIRLKKETDPMGKPVAVTMRTPGDDLHLALGFLFTEGIIKHKSEYLDGIQKEENVVEIIVSQQVNTDMKNADRNFYTTSSCGVCGKASIEAIKVSPHFSQRSDFKVDVKLVYSLLDKMNATQSAFKLTGGIHASALFDKSGELLSLSEDVGRHNALDKLIGQNFIDEKLPLHQNLLLLSGRASFELIQKAAMAGIAIVAAVGAPSSLAIDLAIEHEITLIGFLKEGRFNVYSAPERIST